MKKSGKQPLTKDQAMIRAMAEKNNDSYREANKEKYKIIKRCEKSRFWRWFYSVFEK
jgi:hypothetical protein